MSHSQLTSQKFIIGGATHAALKMPCMPNWHAAAQKKGFDLLGRAFDRYHVVVRCHACQADALVRLNVVRDHNPLCHHCIHKRRVAAAAAINAQFLSHDDSDRHYGHFRLDCGHVVRSQFIRVEAAAAGGHEVGCDTCREARNATNAQKVGWTLIGPAAGGKTGYRTYRHKCGHEQDVMVGNMLWGDCTCAKCGTGWSAAKSFIYLFRIALPRLVVLKFGYSARPAKRLRHQLGIDRKNEAEVLRVVPMPSGNRVVNEEQASHSYLRKSHPSLTVPKAEFGESINTQGEIYRHEAKDILNGLMDGIAQRYPVD